MLQLIADGEPSIRSLALTTIIGILSGAVSGWIAFLLKRRELVETTIQAIEERRGTLQLETDEARQDRIRSEILRWANPLLGAVQDLTSRLHNILDANGYKALKPAYDPSTEPNWAISHEYILLTTLYLFGQFFACIRMIQEELSFEMFRSEELKNEFFTALQTISSQLGRYPVLEKNPVPAQQLSGTDVQVFRLQQRAIGELMIIRDTPRRWFTYPEFLAKYQGDPTFKNHFSPLTALLVELNREDPTDRRHRRLRAVSNSIDTLEQLCKRVLSLQ
jgi:hypothetical protein